MLSEQASTLHVIHAHTCTVTCRFRSSLGPVPSPRPIIKCFHPNLHGHAGVLNVGKLTKNRRFTPFQLPVDTFCFCVTNFQNFQSTRKEVWSYGEYCLLQNYFSQEWMPIVTFPTKDKSQMFVGVNEFLVWVGKKLYKPGSRIRL